MIGLVSVMRFCLPYLNYLLNYHELRLYICLEMTILRKNTVRYE